VLQSCGGCLGELVTSDICSVRHTADVKVSPVEDYDNAQQ
jgi:hypothetical protein